MTRPLLVLGAGGREHALARALSRSRPHAAVIVAPGNGGIPLDAGASIRRVPIDLADNAAVVALARAVDAELVIVGPEAPLCAGVVDALDAAGIPAFGPTRAAARLEGSKAFLKELAARRGIPTARFVVARTMAEARAAIATFAAPPVVKADGLCGGKGVVVADSHDEAIAAASSMLEDRAFGEAGATIVIEERIVGREVSLLAVTDGVDWLALPTARDHKRVSDGDRGPNTGGMGVVSPAPDIGVNVTRLEREIIEPTITGMREAGAPFRGVLFAGIMVDAAGTPYLLEHNARFGDPECEALLEHLDGDVAGLLASAARGALDKSLVRLRTNIASCVVVLAAHGYPGEVRIGDEITGIGPEGTLPGVRIHHAGTALDEKGVLRTSGGRVIAVTANAPTLGEARDRAYRAARLIHFDGCHYRTDIGGPPWTP